MLTAAIDVWNLATFDEELLALLRTYGTALLHYQVTSRNNYEEQQAAHGWVPLKDNPFAADRMFILEQIMMPAMEQRTIRAWHYTRLTDGEVDRFRVNGIQTSDLKGIQRRLDEQVAAGALDSATAGAIFCESPFHAQASSRSGKFWMVSHPYLVTDGGVELLLQHWGGEGVYFWLTKPFHIESVQRIGRPRIIEVAVPLSVTSSVYMAANAVVATYVASLGGKPNGSAFDLYATSSLGADAVLAVHSEGDPTFADMALGYPVGFVER
ncbi:hypothetical protein [Agrobacterium cavarae]|uniref:hypothetical protein n=1 Tax=Agrobacterium cavarae TaxID=2528239 RepID=UPI0028AB2B4C|nr:hypothetical protein [Agrobacterium cavarae]